MVHHSRSLRLVARNDKLADLVATDFENAPISGAEKAMLRYARKLTSDPDKMKKEDVNALREAQWSDAAILDICQITGYFNFVNRLADGLGVQLED